MNILTYIFHKVPRGTLNRKLGRLFHVEQPFVFTNQKNFGTMESARLFHVEHYPLRTQGWL